MILSQFLLAFQEPLTVALRETFYPIQENVWNERAVFSRLSSDAFTLFRGFRLGGFWYNPNVFASNLFLIYVVFYSSSRYLLSIKNKFKKRSGKVTFLGCSFLVFLSLLSSGSRSFIVGFILLILISNKKYFLKIASLKGSFFSSLIFLTISTFIVLFNFIASLFQAFSTGGSFDTKLSILKNYHLNSADFLTIFTGAGFIGFPFDFEYSYWFVLGGLFSLLGLIIFYIRISAYRSLNFLFLTIPLLLAGIGNSILFGLMSGSLLIPVLIIVYSLEYRKNIYLPLEK